MTIAARYVHTNLIARDWRRLADFYVQVLGCQPVPPERHLSDPWLGAATGIPGAALDGMHLRLPGWGENGPTLEIFQYRQVLERPPLAANLPGFSHLSFLVEDVPAALEAVRAAGGGVLGQMVTAHVPGAGRITFVYATDPEGNLLELQRWSHEPELVLVRPSVEYAQPFRDMVDEFHAAGEKRYERYLDLIQNDFAGYVTLLEQHARGEHLPEADYVPQEEHWLVELESWRVLGAIRLRRQLTPALEQIGGHIGFNVRPTFRRKGYGRLMLAMLLEKVRAEGALQRVLLTCDATNAGSRRIIESNGGRLENQVIDENGQPVLRYWIEVGAGYGIR